MFSSEMLRFSHGIPAYRLSGKERKGVPERCIHLDPAALPSGLEKFDPSRDDLHFLTLNAVIDSGNTSTKNNRGARRKKTEKVNASSHRRPILLNEEPCKAKELDNRKIRCDASCVDKSGGESKTMRHLYGEHLEPSVILPENSHSRSYKLPGSDIHDFEEARSGDVFQHGQFWAVYSKEDGLPKYNAQVGKVETQTFSVTVRGVCCL